MMVARSLFGATLGTRGTSSCVPTLLRPGPRLGLERVPLRLSGTFAGCLGSRALCPPNPSTRSTIHPYTASGPES